MRTFPFFILLLLCACGTETRSVIANRESISFVSDGEDDALEEASRRAEAHCNQYGRIASMRGTSTLGQDYLVHYQCVNSSPVTMEGAPR